MPLPKPEIIQKNGPKTLKPRGGSQTTHLPKESSTLGSPVLAKKLQIVVARGLLLANIRAPFPDSGFGAQKTARLVGSLAENELGRCRLRRFFASSETHEVVR
jgi:hypothetical protein